MPYYDITDCVHLANECLEKSALTIMDNKPDLSKNFLELSRNFLVLGKKYSKLMDNESENMTDILKNYLMDNKSGEIYFGEFDPQKDVLKKEFDSLFSVYQALGDFQWTILKNIWYHYKTNIKIKHLFGKKIRHGYFERILCDNEVILELERYYKTKTDPNGFVETTKEIDLDLGYIVLYFFNDGQHKNSYNFYGIDVEDPYMKDLKANNKLHLSLTGSEWVINKCIPFLFCNDCTVIQKLKDSLIKENKILNDFKGDEWWE